MAALGQRAASQAKSPWPAFCLLAALLNPPGAWAAAYQFTLDTAPLNGAAAQFALDFIDGGPPANSVAVTGFASDGVLGGSTPTGDVVGMLPGGVILGDGDFFNESLTGITLGDSISFVFAATGHAPAGGSSPDSFSVFLIDPSTGSPLFATTDPVPGSNALFRFDIDGTAEGVPLAFSARNGEVALTVALLTEPATWTLFAVGALATALSPWRRPGAVRPD
jgi:hypothetical protein